MVRPRVGEEGHFISLIRLEKCYDSPPVIFREVMGPWIGPGDGDCSGLTLSDYYGFFPTTMPCLKAGFGGTFCNRWSEVVA
jgi:hypothetical protein